MNIKKQQLNLKTFVGSLAVALVISAQYINTISGIYFGKSILTPILIVTLVLTLISNGTTLKINGSFILVIFAILLWSGSTYLFAESKSSGTFMDIIALCILPCIVGAIANPDYKMVMKICMLTLCFGIPIFQDFYTKGNAGSAYDAISMTNSYSIVPVIMIGIVYGIMFWRESKLYEKILILISVANYLNFIVMSYRGALLASLLIIVICIFTSRGKMSQKKKILFVIFAIVISIILLNLNELIILTNSFLKNRGITIAALEKSAFLEGESNLLHGRSEIWLAALNGFLEKPIVGHGISTFEYYTHYVFPHNLVLQFLFDGGIFLAVPLTISIIKNIIDVFKRVRFENRYHYATILVVMCVSLSRTLFSANTWRVIPLWLFVGIMTNSVANNGLETEVNLNNG